MRPEWDASNFHKTTEKVRRVPKQQKNTANTRSNGDTFHNHRYLDPKDDKRWVTGVPPAGNANAAWKQHCIHHLPASGNSGARTTRPFRVV